MTPTPKSGSKGMPGRSCFRAAPAGSTRSRRDAKVWDALRFVFLMRAPEPEHRNQSIADVSQIAVSKLPSSPGQPYLGFRYLELQPRHGPAGGGHLPTVVSVRTWALGAMGPVIPEPAGCGNVGCWSPDPASWRRSVGLQHGTRGLREWMNGCSAIDSFTIAFTSAFTPVSTPTPVGGLLLGNHALAGVIPGRSRRPLSGRSRCPPAPRRDDHRRGSHIPGPIRNCRC